MAIKHGRAARKLPVVKGNEGPLYWARRPFQYGERKLFRGQVVRLEGMPNDEKLVRLGYFAELRKDQDTRECGKCGAEFVDDMTRNGHVKTDHERIGASRTVALSDLPESERRRMLSETLRYETEESPGGVTAPEDEDDEHQERFLEQVAPLNLDRTAAARA